MKRLFLAVALLLAPLTATAATITVPAGQPILLHQNEFSMFDVTDFETFSLSFVNAAQWSGGSILYTTNDTLTKPWEATYAGNWSVNFLHPQAQVWTKAFDTTQAFMRFFAVSTYGSTLVHANATGSVDAPAPVPLPAGLGLLFSGLGILGTLRRRAISQWCREVYNIERGDPDLNPKSCGWA